MKTLKLWFFSYMATMHYNAMSSLRDKYGCGRALSGYLNPKINHHENRMKYWITKIKRMEKNG